MSPKQAAASTATVFISKTEHYLKVKKPLLERQRRARMNQYLDALKTLIAEFQGDDAILRMDKAEMLESTLTFMRAQAQAKKYSTAAALPNMDSFRNGYMNAVNEISRVMAATPGMSVDVGKTVMTQLGSEFNRLLQSSMMAERETQAANKFLERPLSPASSGYHSDCESESQPASPTTESSKNVWRPW